MGIFLGLFTALAWGNSDFLARFATHRIGSLRTTLYMQVTGLLLLTACLPYVGGWGHLHDGSGWQPWAWGALAGVCNGFASLALYRSFEIGKMAVVAPLSASYPALTVILSFFSGEHLTSLRAAGIVLVLAGVVAVARCESAPVEPAPSMASSGVGWAMLSSVGFGILFWLLGTRVVPSVGFAATVWMIRLTSSLLTAVVILAIRQPIGLPRSASVSGLLLSMGFLDTAAFVLNNWGMQLEQISVVSVLASLYGAVTVLLAAAFLHERLARWQWIGIGSIFTGIGLISR
jgi:drug/metabolite transporter (DMT)-like permease